MLTLTGVTKSYPGRAGELVVLRDVSLEVAAGASVAIIGPSGAGKSTLLNVIGTLDPPTAGQVRVGDDDPYALPPRRLAQFRNRHIGFVFQDHCLLPQCSVLENVLLPTLAGPADAAAPARAAELIKRVGLAERLAHRPAELSGGERQRVALARALVMQPTLVLADEPTGNLDAATAAEVGALLAAVQRELGTTLIVVTHSTALAAQCDRRLELRAGALVAAL
jgi:lipoprotein-releasing system ATP-binding protein